MNSLNVVRAGTLMDLMNDGYAAIVANDEIDKTRNMVILRPSEISSNWK